MSAAEGEYLLTWFRTFYTEVVRIKQAILAGIPIVSHVRFRRPVALLHGTSEPQNGQDPPDETLDLVLGVQDRLLRLLEPQGKAADRIGGVHSVQTFRQAQYVMAALADEVFLTLPWKGQTQWKEHLLETKLFQTAVAGDLFFERLELLVREGDATQVELAKVYLMALVISLQGRYLGSSDRVALAAYRDELYAFISRYDTILDRDRLSLFTQAESHTLSEGTVVMVPNPYLWAWVLAVVMLSLTLVSWGAWRGLTNETWDALHEIPRTEVTR